MTIAPRTELTITCQSPGDPSLSLTARDIAAALEALGLLEVVVTQGTDPSSEGSAVSRTAPTTRQLRTGVRYTPWTI
jgi:hypothetical protein